MQSTHGSKLLERLKMSCAINSKFFKKLDHVNPHLFEVEPAKAEVEHNGPVVVEYFRLQFAKQPMSELFFKFLVEFCDIKIFEVLGMDSTEKELTDCLRPDM